MYSVLYLFSNSLIAQNSTFQWAYQLNVSEKAIAIDTNGSVLRTGGYLGTVDLDPEVGVQNFTSAGLFDIYIEKIDTNGHLLWVKSIGSSGDDLAQSITTDTEGNVYVAGIYGGTVDFDPGVGVFTMYGDYTNGLNYLQKLRPCNLIQSIDEIEACDSYTWIDGNTYTQDNNTATYHYVGGAANGCDSVVLLNLTIQPTHGSTIIASNNFASYVWLDCNNNYAIIPGETMQSYTSITGGSFAVELTENGCVDTSTCIQIAPMGMVESTFSNLFTIAPNPTKGKFSIIFELAQKYIDVKIYSVLGKVIKQLSFENQFLIDLEINEAKRYVYSCS